MYVVPVLVLQVFVLAAYAAGGSDSPLATVNETITVANLIAFFMGHILAIDEAVLGRRDERRDILLKAAVREVFRRHCW